MKNLPSILFLIFLSIWFTTSLYLSINFLVGNFVDLNPNIAKMFLSYSFLGLAGTSVYNKYAGKKLDNIIQDAKEIKENQEKKRSGCKSCKSKK